MGIAGLTYFREVFISSKRNNNSGDWVFFKLY